jgi:hypothetical protein
LPIASDAALYKWTDANGRVVYSDQPPAGNVKAETLRGAPPPSNPNAVKEMAAKEAEIKKQKMDAAESAKKTEAQAVEAARRNERCLQAQGQIKMLGADQIPVVRTNEKGEIVYLDEATRRKERADLESWTRANCAPAKDG